MYKLYAVWTAPSPEHAEAFERHYVDTHLPLAAAIPGVRRLVATRTSDSLGDGESALHRITELWFDDRAALERAWSSEVGQIALAHSRESHSDRLVLITEEHELIG